MLQKEKNTEHTRTDEVKETRKEDLLKEYILSFTNDSSSGSKSREPPLKQKLVRLGNIS